MEIFEPKYYKCTRITLEKRIGGMNIFEVTKFVNEPFSDSDTDAPFDNLVSLSIEYTLDASGRKIQAAYTHLNISIDWRYDGVGYRCLHAWSGKPF